MTHGLFQFGWKNEAFFIAQHFFRSSLIHSIKQAKHSSEKLTTIVQTPAEAHLVIAFLSSDLDEPCKPHQIADFITALSFSELDKAQMIKAVVEIFRFLHRDHDTMRFANALVLPINGILHNALVKALIPLIQQCEWPFNFNIPARYLEDERLQAVLKGKTK